MLKVPKEYQLLAMKKIFYLINTVLILISILLISFILFVLYSAYLKPTKIINELPKISEIKKIQLNSIIKVTNLEKINFVRNKPNKEELLTSIIQKNPTLKNKLMVSDFYIKGITLGKNSAVIVGKGKYTGTVELNYQNNKNNKK